MSLVAAFRGQLLVALLLFVPLALAPPDARAAPVDYTFTFFQNAITFGTGSMTVEESVLLAADDVSALNPPAMPGSRFVEIADISSIQFQFTGGTVLTKAHHQPVSRGREGVLFDSTGLFLQFMDVRNDLGAVQGLVLFQRFGPFAQLRFDETDADGFELYRTSGAVAGTFSVLGGGNLNPIPEPTAALQLTAGLLIVASLFRRPR